jgi:hypothetical protein
MQRYGVWLELPVLGATGGPPVEVKVLGAVQIGRYEYSSARSLEWIAARLAGAKLDFAHSCPECGAHLAHTRRFGPVPGVPVRDCPNALCPGGQHRLYWISGNQVRVIPERAVEQIVDLLRQVPVTHRRAG